MKKLKLSLDQLKLESFITELKPEAAEIAKGGTTPSSLPCFEALSIVVSIIDSVHDYGDQESWWHCDETGHSCQHPSGYEASDIITEYGCLLPTVFVC